MSLPPLLKNECNAETEKNCHWLPFYCVCSTYYCVVKIYSKNERGESALKDTESIPQHWIRLQF